MIACQKFALRVPFKKTLGFRTFSTKRRAASPEVICVEETKGSHVLLKTLGRASVACNCSYLILPPEGRGVFSGLRPKDAQQATLLLPWLSLPRSLPYTPQLLCFCPLRCRQLGCAPFCLKFGRHANSRLSISAHASP